MFTSPAIEYFVGLYGISYKCHHSQRLYWWGDQWWWILTVV